MATTQMKKFENYVNYAGSKTETCILSKIIAFENYVNYAGSKTCAVHIYSQYSV